VPITSPISPSKQAESSRFLGGEFMKRYNTMYPCGQAGLPDDSAMTYVNNLRATGVSSGSATIYRTPTIQPRDPTRECNVCVASASRSSEPEPAPCHRATDTQRWARLDELAEARHQLDEELAILHQELGKDPGPCDQQPA
jgi:hypothetical protein